MTLSISPRTQPTPPITPPEKRATWPLPPVAESARAARRQLAAQLLEWRLPCLVDDATVIVSELVTNAVSHGVGPIWHTVRHILTATGEAIRIEVGDHGSAWRGIPAPRRAADDLELGGRGLPVVAALSADWGTWRLPHGVVVWAVLPVVTGSAAGSE